jgi:predicted nucleic acid-binding Zn ribbon protein
MTSIYDECSRECDECPQVSDECLRECDGCSRELKSQIFAVRFE